MRFFKALTTILLLHLASYLPVSAASLSSPTGPVILEISGQIAHGNLADGAGFDMAMLDALPQRDTVTSTPWYDGVQTFSGPKLADLLAAVGATGGSLRVIAINDYAVEIPISDVTDYPVILASRQNGAPMPVREKGPLFVIYPFDEASELVNELYFSRSVWQVKRIEVLP